MTQEPMKSSTIALTPEELVAVATGLKMLAANVHARTFIDAGYGPCWKPGSEMSALFKVEDAIRGGMRHVERSLGDAS
jgi:hypothetical protein